MKIEYCWNPVYTMVMNIKKDYIEQFGEIKEYNLNNWIIELNKKQYNEWISCLQTTNLNELVLIRYGLAEMQNGMWDNENSIYRECRSVTIDLKENELVLTPFKKFFNLNEVKENHIDLVLQKITTAKLIEIVDKLDGSMQVARYYKNNIIMSGSRALDIEKSWRLKDGYSKLTQNHKKMIEENCNYTFIFEYISLKDRHVVKYSREDEGMYLIGIRNTLTGEQLSYSQIRNFSIKYNVPMANIEQYNFNEILNLCKIEQSHSKEGWIINIDGHFIKLKCDDYVNIHRVIDKMSSNNTIIKSIANNTYDDLVSKVPDDYKNIVEDTANLIFNYIKYMHNKVDKYYNMAPKHNIKDFMIWVDNYCPKDIISYCKLKYHNKDYNVLKSGSNLSPKYKKISEIIKDY